MDLEERCFFGKVYIRRTKKKDVSPATIAGITSLETKISKPEKVIPQIEDLLMITNSATSRVVPDGCGGADGNDDKVTNVISRVDDRVRIRLNELRSINEIRDVRRTLEDKLDQVKSLLNKIKAKENHTVIGGDVERAKRIRKENKYYNNSKYLLANDRLPCERNKKAK